MISGRLSIVSGDSKADPMCALVYVPAQTSLRTPSISW